MVQKHHAVKGAVASALMPLVVQFLEHSITAINAELNIAIDELLSGGISGSRGTGMKPIEEDITN